MRKLEPIDRSTKAARTSASTFPGSSAKARSKKPCACVKFSKVRPVRAYAVVREGSSTPATPHERARRGGLSPPRLSIVVLPFNNLSGDPEQDYFVDGVTESLTTDLSRISGSFVIGRHTAFTYKGKAVDLKKIGRELNIRYVLEGSARPDRRTQPRPCLGLDLKQRKKCRYRPVLQCSQDVQQYSRRLQRCHGARRLRRRC